MLRDILTQLWSKRWFKLASIALVVFLLIVVVLNFLHQRNFKSYGLSTTPFSRTQNFSQLQGSAVYAYNGLYFYKVDLESGQTTLLSSADNLPTPSQVVWAGDNGALLNFSGPLAGTSVEAALQNRNEPVNPATQLYTWYLDFKTGQLRFVNKVSMTKNVSVTASDGRGVYYLPDYSGFVSLLDEAELEATSQTINFYSVDDGSDQTITNKLDGLSSVSSMFFCTNFVVCASGPGSDGGGSFKAIGISQDGSPQTVLENVPGRIFASNNPDFMVVTRSEVSGQQIDEEDAEGGMSPSQVFIYDLQAKQERELGFTIAGSSLITHFDGDHFYVFDTLGFGEPASETVFYQTGVLSSKGKPSTKRMELQAKNTRDNAFIYLPLASHGSGSRTLLNPVSGSSTLFSEVGTTNNLQVLDSSAAEQLLRSCQVNGQPGIKYFDSRRFFRIAVPDDAAGSASFASFNTCLANKAQAAMVGFNYGAVLVDPVSGRLISD